MGATCVLCCESRDGAVHGSADRGELPCGVAIVQRSGRRGSVPRRQGARVRLPGMLFCWVGRRWCGTKLSPVLGGMLKGWVRALWNNRSC